MHCCRANASKAAAKADPGHTALYHGIADLHFRSLFPIEEHFASGSLQLVQSYTSQSRKQGLCLRCCGSRTGSAMSTVSGNCR